MDVYFWAIVLELKVPDEGRAAGPLPPVSLDIVMHMIS
jgi:hypothetical protein